MYWNNAQIPIFDDCMTSTNSNGWILQIQDYFKKDFMVPKILGPPTTVDLEKKMLACWHWPSHAPFLLSNRIFSFKFLNLFWSSGSLNISAYNIMINWAKIAQLSFWSLLPFESILAMITYWKVTYIASFISQWTGTFAIWPCMDLASAISIKAILKSSQDLMLRIFDLYMDINKNIFVI